MSSFEDPTLLPLELAPVALELYGETTELRKESLLELRDRIKELPLNDQLDDTSDKSLIRFLRFRKYDLEKSLQGTIDLKHFNDKHSSILNNLKGDEFLQFEKFLVVLEQTDSNGRVIVIMQPAKGVKLFTPELLKANPRAMLRFNVWMFERLSHDPRIQVHGMIVINTFKNLTFWDQIAMNNMAPMSDQLDTFKYFQILGIRFSGAYIFEEPSFFDLIWFLVKPFLSNKIKERFHLCGSNYDILKTLFEDIKILPTILGGLLDDDNITYSWLRSQIELEKSN